MKVFLSWSGARSRAVAELLNRWIKCVLQATRPWISTHNIDRGALWFSEISNQLAETSVGIVCLTHENQNRPWILFEAGALAKGLPQNRVCTFLIDLEPKDVTGPLSQFNHTFPTQESIFGLMRMLNVCLGEHRLDDGILGSVFETYWPHFKERFESILKEHPPIEPVEPRPQNEILAEILENTRSLNQRIRLTETNQAPMSKARQPDETLKRLQSTLEEIHQIQNSIKRKKTLAELDGRLSSQPDDTQSSSSSTEDV